MAADQMDIETAPEEIMLEAAQPAKSLQMQAERNEVGQFLKGQSGNPAGRRNDDHGAIVRRR